MLPAYTLRTKKLKHKLIGSADKFSLESRIFHTFSVFVLITLICETLFNFAIHLYVSALLTVLVFAIQVFLYYLSRFKNKLGLAIALSVIEINVISGAGYFYNGGVSGATLLLFAASLFVILSVSKRKHWGLIVFCNIFSVLLVTSMEYRYPQSIRVQYNSNGEKIADNVASYIITIALLLIGTAAIRKNYTRQKQLADEKALALELLNAEKVKLFSIIAHDLRTPLASVQQYFSIITEVQMEQAERAELEQNLLSTIASTQELLTNLLKWAKNQMDGGTAHLQPLDLYNFLEGTATLFEAIALKKGIVLDVQTDDDIMIMADADMLQIVLRNLLNNAVKFTHSNGRIELKAHVKGKNCIITISDNGLGIPADKQADLFSLNTISTNGTKNEHGTGLGLVLCKDYTELQGGTIWFNSTEGKGTSFYISLPLYLAARPAPVIAL